MSPFEAIRHSDDDGQEFWSARELMVTLGYTKWQNFRVAVSRAREACENSGHTASDHFTDVSNMIQIGKGGQRKVEDFHLSRYACYLIVQNADPEKPIVALGQTYFATQTRQAELTEDAERVYLRDQVSEHNKKLAASAYEVGVVTSQDFAIFTDHGYMGLYNGERARDIAARKGLKRGQPILDWMGTEELVDSLFRQVQAEARIRREGAASREEANRIHHQVGQQVRRFIIEELEGTPPEQLPTPTESVQAVRSREQRRMQAERQPSLFPKDES
ncbi:MAG TPA: DNA damage-inducible protein D [Ktedonobacterales bacterium]|nr:DNA damage-inducible protein D [Ktedonobacterales bacterium]